MQRRNLFERLRWLPLAPLLPLAASGAAATDEAARVEAVVAEPLTEELAALPQPMLLLDEEGLSGPAGEWWLRVGNNSFAPLARHVSDSERARFASLAARAVFWQPAQQWMVAIGDGKGLRELGSVALGEARWAELVREAARLGR